MESGLCSNCNERGHFADKCPVLHDPLRDGFYKGGGGGGGGGDGGGDDDDDEHILKQYYHILNKDDCVVRRFFIHMDILSSNHSCSIHSNVLQEFQIPCIINEIRC